MVSKKKSSKKDAIRIRMYRVGFGDCFLLSLPVGDEGNGQFKHFVIDCGVHAKGNIGKINDAVDDIAVETGGKIAAVIATHSHQDHISGFSDKFTGFDIGEVWMPWVEDPKDEVAQKWSKKQAGLASQLEQHFAAQARLKAPAAATGTRQEALAALVNLTSNEEIGRLLSTAIAGKPSAAKSTGGKLVTNAKALGLLKGGFNGKAKVKYFGGGKAIKDAAGIPGLDVQVLGPPRDQAFLARMDPPKDQAYLRIGDSGAVEVENKVNPFSAKWIVKFAKDKHPLDAAEEKLLRDSLVDESLDALAFTLDSAKNNTSLVTLFTYKGRTLLFPGDAQYGNWESWLSGKDSHDLLANVDFLKVAHHASHNGTPKDALENMTSSDFAAMVSTQSVPWKVIPRVPLMETLFKKTSGRVVRSDWIKVTDAPGPLPKSAPPIPSKLPNGFSAGSFWYDYEIPL